MDNLPFLSGVALGALLAGYLLVEYYDRFDLYFFGHVHKDYKPFGRYRVIASAVCGIFISGVCVLGCSGFFDSGVVAVVGAVAIGAIGVCNLHVSCIRMHTLSARLGKFAFLSAACSLGFGVGILWSLPLFMVLAC